MLICKVHFRRKKDDVLWEEGIGFSVANNEMDLDTIVDFQGKHVDSLWNFRPDLAKFAITVEPDWTTMRGGERR